MDALADLLPSYTITASSTVTTPILDFVTGLVAAGRVTVTTPLAMRLLEHVALSPAESGVGRLAASTASKGQAASGAGGY